MTRVKGFIFDMDNTLLRSKIDFQGMKYETFSFLVSQGFIDKDIDLSLHTTATLINEATKSNELTEEEFANMWEIPERFEIDGMKDAELEDGAIDILDELKKSCRLSVVTNNSDGAAHAALSHHNIIDYFDFIVGRESMGAMKPSPDGFQLVLEKYNDISKEEWLSVGDSWVDGKASSSAGLTFIAYRGDIEKMNKMGVFPAGTITELRELKNYIEGCMHDI